MKDIDGPANLDLYINGGAAAMDRMLYYNKHGVDMADMDPRDNAMVHNIPQLDYTLDE